MKPGYTVRARIVIGCANDTCDRSFEADAPITTTPVRGNENSVVYAIEMIAPLPAFGWSRRGDVLVVGAVEYFCPHHLPEFK